jgi:hypothetical protein
VYPTVLPCLLCIISILNDLVDSYELMANAFMDDENVVKPPYDLER